MVYLLDSFIAFAKNVFLCGLDSVPYIRYVRGVVGVVSWWNEAFRPRSPPDFFVFRL